MLIFNPPANLNIMKIHSDMRHECELLAADIDLTFAVSGVGERKVSCSHIVFQV